MMNDHDEGQNFVLFLCLQVNDNWNENNEKMDIDDK